MESFVEVLKSAAYDIPAIQIQLEYRKSELEAMEHKMNKFISEVNNLHNELAYLQSLRQHICRVSSNHIVNLVVDCDRT